MARKILLDIETLTAPDRAAIRINGTEYELRAHDELSIRDQIELSEFGKAIGEASGSIEKAEAATKALRQFVNRVVMGLPEAVAATISDSKCLAILNAFTAAAGNQAQPQPPKPEGA